MENLGAMADSRYTGFREITDGDVLGYTVYLKFGLPGLIVVEKRIYISESD